LRTSFVDLKCPAFYVKPVEFANGLGGVGFGGQLDKSESARAACFSVGNDASGADLISLLAEQLHQSFIGHAEGEISNV
jgi:hypothetical protein